MPVEKKPYQRTDYTAHEVQNKEALVAQKPFHWFAKQKHPPHIAHDMPEATMEKRICHQAPNLVFFDEIGMKRTKIVKFFPTVAKLAYQKYQDIEDYQGHDDRKRLLISPLHVIAFT